MKAWNLAIRWEIWAHGDGKFVVTQPPAALGRKVSRFHQKTKLSLHMMPASIKSHKLLIEEKRKAEKVAVSRREQSFQQLSLPWNHDHEAFWGLAGERSSMFSRWKSIISVLTTNLIKQCSCSEICKPMFDIIGLTLVRQRSLSLAWLAEWLTDCGIIFMLDVKKLFMLNSMLKGDCQTWRRGLS